MQGLDQRYVNADPDRLIAISVVGQDRSGEVPVAADAGAWADGLDLSLVVVADTTGEFWPRWNPTGVLPVTYVIDPAGVVTWADFGDASALPAIIRHVDSLLEAWFEV